MRRLKTVRRPPIYPKTPGHLPCSSLTHPLPLSSRRPSVSFGGFGIERRVNGVGSHPKESLASLDAIEADSATLNGGGRVRKPPASPRRKPTPRQRVRWKAVQQAKLRGLSIRAIARELGIHRNTVRKYAEAKSPPMMPTRGRSRVSQSDRMTAA